MAGKPKVKVRTKTTEKDRGLKNIIKELKKLEDRPFVKAGYPAEFKPGDKFKRFSVNEGTEVDISSEVTVLDTAIWNEFGTETIPERSHVRQAFDKNRPKYEKQTKRLLIKIYKSEMSVERALDILGLMLETDIKDMIRNGNFEPNAISTVLRKGSDKPLIDTAQMLNSVRFKRIMKGFFRKKLGR